MKVLKQTVAINKPIREVFAFVVNPDNTPKWINSIVQEQTSEWPVKLGTIYRNQRKDASWSEYEVTAFEPDKIFMLNKKDDDFYVKYTFTPVSKSVTELEYELPDNGKIDQSFIKVALDNLKYVMELEATK